MTRLAIVALLLGSVTCASPVTSVRPSPTQDPATVRYVLLVHNYWIQYKAAEGNPEHFINVCLGLVQDPRRVDSAACHAIGIAILLPHENFLKSLDFTTAPTRFKADDQVFRAQLPKAIADIQAMVDAAANDDKEAVVRHTKAYADDMIPSVTRALDDVDPTVVHD